MPPLTRWLIKTALIYLVLALVAGVLLAARLIWSLPLPATGLDAVYLHLFMVGWVTQLIFGVAYWMFPTYSREAPRRSPLLGRAVFVLLNGGLVLRATGELGRRAQGDAWSWLLLLSSVLLWLAAIGFVANTWGRIRGR